MTTRRLPTFSVFALVVVAATVIATDARLRPETVDARAQGIPPYVDVRTIESDVKAVVDFNRRVADYAALHRQLEGPLPAIQVSDDMRVVRDAMNALARALQAGRKDAERGDLLTPEISRVFQKRIAAVLAPEQWDAILAEHRVYDPVPMPVLQVNARWPESMPFHLVPPVLLSTLPPLPPELQYRIIGRSLVLWDPHADLIVDFMPGAFTS